MTAANSGFAAQQHHQQQDAFDSMSNVAIHHHHQHPASTFPQMHHHQQSNSFYASSHASASSSSLVDQLSDHESSYSTSFEPHAEGSFTAQSSARSGPGPSSSSQGFPCPNCGKAFARDDLLRRHLAREARALAQPSFDRQKSCYECARSKARCDLEVPTCGRCRARGKQCQYAPRSGNPNVRKARNVGVIHNTLDTHVHSMTPQLHPAVPSAMPPHPMHNATWPMQTPDFNMASAAFMTPNPNYANRDADVDYDSQSESEHHSWHDPASSASGSALGSPRSQHSIASQPDSAPPNLANFSISATPAAASYANVAPPIRTESPHSFHDLNLDSDAAPAPPRMPARKSSGFSRTNTGPIVTNIDRANVAFANEEGEETPIVRLSNHLPTDASKLHTNLNNNNFLAAPHSRHRTTSMPEAVENSLPEDDNMHEPWHQRSNASQSAFNDSASARQQLHPASAHNAMMPPPRPPTLITSNLNNRSAWPNPSPIRSAVFQHGIDLSGWLAEPVVPSPLYRMGPSLHSAISGNFAAISHSPVVDTPISAKFAASLAQTMGLSTNPGFLPMFQDPNAAPSATATAAAATATATAAGTNSHPLSRSLSDSNTPPQSRYDCDGQLVLPAPQLPSAKQWWIQPDQSGEVAASIAQASAAHFVSYPALIVLTDPTAPIPPFIHRKWLQENRASVPESLANARSILAGYYVRLPASQSLIWRLISEQIRLIVADKPQLTAANADPVPVFGAVAALWMYLVLIVFTDEPAITDHVSAELLDEALLVLSDVSQALLAHAVRACEAASQQSTPSLATFGWIETMVRTLFASYSLLVLQRFRENAGNARERLAGCSLILDLPLPAAAGEFEADKEADWMQAHTANQNALSEAGAPFVRPTLRQLVQLRNDAVRSAAEGQTESVKDELRDLPWACTLFDHHDEFTNVVLSVAFALDDTRL